ncbi:hypothetical protein SAMN04487910_0474 [Aquimarina amphilecti]|uniref:Uncharacterized protein n=1 Tax=Aquimarina amphilecti TaxID=1038014 RepID=A0A1H7GTV4_AQUAM|nr:hypothetical protein [Aquimarina amphilecti]SEK41586.1 hypothetical protein SAMN04487910_0474 [Aquimarina amphilecti]
MSHEFLKLDVAKKISKREQKTINGGILSISLCSGVGTLGGSPGDEGTSPACVNRNGNCLINGYQAVCSGNSQGGFWYL